MNEEVAAGYFPAIEGITSGKTFRPSKALRDKYWFSAVMVAIMTWIMVIGSVYGISLLVSLDEGWSHTLFISEWMGTVNYWTTIAELLWMIPAAVAIPFYVNSIEYSVISETGEAAPEIYCRKGIINVTKKHVPFRTITNISSRAGVIDRLFGIGNVEIQTAGYSGGPGGQTGPEEKLEGIKAYEALTRFIVAELRRFREPYATGTEIPFSRDDAVQRIEGSLNDEILMAIRDIREILRTKL